jgi:hypothetical protein
MTRRVVAMAFAWVAMVMFGGMVVETWLIYPNVFADVPASLDRGLAFFTEVGPSAVFPRLGVATGVTGVATLVVCWRDRAVRPFAAGAVGCLLLGELVFSMLYFWPRNDIMFDQRDQHPVDVLVRTAAEFETGHWFRLALSGVTAGLAFTALWRTRDRAAVAV